jgi:hypothetical protein
LADAGRENTSTMKEIIVSNNASMKELITSIAPKKNTVRYLLREESRQWLLLKK